MLLFNFYSKALLSVFIYSFSFNFLACTPIIMFNRLLYIPTFPYICILTFAVLIIFLSLQEYWRYLRENILFWIFHFMMKYILGWPHLGIIYVDIYDPSLSLLLYAMSVSAEMISSTPMDDVQQRQTRNGGSKFTKLAVSPLQKMEIETFRLFFLQRMRACKRPPPSLRATGFNNKLTNVHKCVHMYTPVYILTTLHISWSQKECIAVGWSLIIILETRCIYQYGTRRV